MTLTTTTIARKCPKCALLIWCEEFLSGHIFGQGLNHMPIGTPFDSASVLACPRCSYAEYTSEFPVVKQESRTEIMGRNEDKVEILLDVAQKRENEGKTKEALHLYLVASWYHHQDKEDHFKILRKILSLIVEILPEKNSHSKPVRLLKSVFSSISSSRAKKFVPKTYNQEELTVAEQGDLLNLGINLCSQIGLDQTKAEFDILTRFGKKKGLIIKEKLEWLNQTREIIIQKKDLQKVQQAKRTLDQGDPYCVQYANNLLKTSGLTNNEIEKILRSFLNNKYLSNEKKYFFSSLDIYEILGYYEKINEMAYKSWKTGKIIVAKEAHKRLYLPIPPEVLKEAIETAISKKLYTHACDAFKEALGRYERSFSDYERETLNRIASEALKNNDFYTASLIFCKLNEEEQFDKTIRRALEQKSTDFYCFAIDYYYQKYDSKMLNQLGYAYLNNGDFYSARDCFKKNKDYKGLTKVAEGHLDKGDIIGFNSLYDYGREDLNLNRDKVIRCVYKSFKERKDPSSVRLNNSEDWLRCSINIFVILGHNEGIIELGNIALTKGELSNALSAFEKVKFIPGIKKTILRGINKWDFPWLASSFLRIVKEIPDFPADKIKLNIIEVGKKASVAPYFYEQFGSPKKWENSVKRWKENEEKEAYRLLRIGDLRAFTIFKNIYTPEKIEGIVDTLLHSGRINDALTAYQASYLFS